MQTLIPFILLFPFIGFLILSLRGNKLSKSLASTIGSLAVACSFAFSAVLFFSLLKDNSQQFEFVFFDWISAGSFKANLSLMVDPLSSLFLLIITGIGALIHLYSAGYMHDDQNHNKFFAYLNLFIFFMLLLVLGSNYLVMFIGWEGVGLCSYLLIGFWHKNQDYNDAAKKAFVMNRIGDLGFLMGIILLFITFGSIEYKDVFAQAKSFPAGDNVFTLITIFLFIGAMGKSAQIPLFTWLPDAMAGPTPVSALIHAATMVTAGIYMIARSSILFALSPVTMEFIAIIGIATALLAAFIGLAQNDIKKVLAYSTVSQLGYMFVALGVGAFSSGVFHVVTHAFFKACLFLGAGSVIHAMGGEQDIRKMGGLKSSIPKTYLTFLIATLAIAGIFPFAGFFSKDEILAHVFAHNKILWLLGLIGSMLTAFYMFRLLFLTFFGEFRGSKYQKEHLHESPATMTIPLIVLAVLSLIGGFMGIPEVFHMPHLFNEFLSPVFKDTQIRQIPLSIEHSTEYALMAVALVSAIIAIGIAYSKYISSKEIPPSDAEPKSFLHNLISRKFFVDEIYETLFVKPIMFLSSTVSRFFEKEIIDGAVNFSGYLVQQTSSVLRLFQTGNIGSYILVMVLGIIAMLGMLYF